MKLAVMQPYLFPYIGYYQLVYASDLYVFYDDVSYIKGGYINRNNILTKNGRQLITLPVNKASSFSLINELNFSQDVRKMLQSIRQAYSKAPYFNEVYPIIEEVINNDDRNVANITSRSIISVFNYLGVSFDYAYSSKIGYDRGNSAEDKLYELCSILGAEYYINSIGGEKLYCKADFSNKGIKLDFLSPLKIEYAQFNNINSFEENLSIIDILMNNSKQDVINLLSKFELK